MKPQQIHYNALFLNPPFKELKICNDDQKNEIYNSINSLSLDIPTNEQYSSGEELTSSSNTPFWEYMDIRPKNVSPQEEIKIEIQKYKCLKVAPDCNICKFWNNAKELPMLRFISSNILCIPTSSASSEKVFSTSGRILEERRSCLCCENVDKLLFLNKNM